jgi:simple sugar transport system permease protein
MNKSIPLLNQDIVVYSSIILVILVWWFMRKTRLGLVLACVGESPSAADALGLPVVMRYFAVMFGGAMAFFSAFVISRLRIRRCGRKI